MSRKILKELFRFSETQIDEVKYLMALSNKISDFKKIQELILIDERRVYSDVIEDFVIFIKRTFTEQIVLSILNSINVDSPKLETIIYNPKSNVIQALLKNNLLDMSTKEIKNLFLIAAQKDGLSFK